MRRRRRTHRERHRLPRRKTHKIPKATGRAHSNRRMPRQISPVRRRNQINPAPGLSPEGRRRRNPKAIPWANQHNSSRFSSRRNSHPRRNPPSNRALLRSRRRRKVTGRRPATRRRTRNRRADRPIPIMRQAAGLPSLQPIRRLSLRTPRATLRRPTRRSRGRKSTFRRLFPKISGPVSARLSAG